MKYRLNLYLEAEHARRLREVAQLKGTSLSGIVAAALTQYYSPDATQARSTSTAGRLDRLSHQFGALERDQNILIETIALYLRYYLALSVPLPDDRQDAARAQGQARFAQFVARLGRQLQQGDSFVRTLADEIYPEDGMSRADGDASASSDSPS